jgi:predicted Zn-dependent protease
MSAADRAYRLAPLLLAAAACTTTPFGRTQLTLVSESHLESQASALYEAMRTQQPISHDDSKRSLVLCVANALTAVLPPGSPRRWEVTLFEDDSANAFALPGAKIGVNTGLLQVAQNQDQLAAVVGHEVAHVLERHANARASNRLAAEFAVGVSTVAIGGTASTAEQQALAQVLGLGAQFGALLPFSRSHESVADKFGLDIMADAGFDPRESVQLWRNMAAASHGQPLEWISTHPSHQTRIADLRERMPRAIERSRRAQEAGRRPHCK